MSLSVRRILRLTSPDFSAKLSLAFDLDDSPRRVEGWSRMFSPGHARLFYLTSDSRYAKIVELFQLGLLPHREKGQEKWQKP